MECQPLGVDTFSAENIRNCEGYILSIQRRLDKAVADNDKKGIRETFDLLTKRSDAVKVVAIWRITQRNKDKYTAGIDGVSIPKGESREVQNQVRHRLMKEIDLDKTPDNIRRVFIPKPNGKKRPLGMPTISDRIVQEIIRTGLDPIAEYHFHGQSYGFRPKRSCHDAIRHLHKKLSRENCPRYVIEGDIKGCFDNINHDYIIKTLREWLVPNWAIENIEKILKSGIFYNGEVYDSETGTPQGGVISPLLANVALTTLDNDCNRFARKSNPIVRYADDFVIVCKSKQEAVEVKQKVAEHLQKHVGLELSEEKTKITHIYKGFNFLGFNLKKYKTYKEGGRVKYTLWITPQKEKVNEFQKSCKEVLKKHATTTQSSVIKLLKPKIIGWGMYYRHVISANTFHRNDGKLWQKLLRWGRRRHPKKNKQWVREKYFKKHHGTQSWYFTDNETGEQLPLMGKIATKRFIKVRNDIRVYGGDTETIEYWKKREYLNAYDQIDSVKRRNLFKWQKGTCPHCNGSITSEDILGQEVHIHHVIPKSEGGTDSYCNLQLTHMECHREIHGKKDDVNNWQRMVNFL